MADLFQDVAGLTLGAKPSQPVSSSRASVLRYEEDLVEYLHTLPNTVVLTWLDDKYQYAAIKIDMFWYTTATTENPYVEHVMTSEEMAATLLHRQAQIATGWRRFHDAPF